jgi:hypothetical protein
MGWFRPGPLLECGCQLLVGRTTNNHQKPPTVLTRGDVMLVKSDAGIWDWRKHDF